MTEYQICNNCVMDTTDPEILFFEDGTCNHCKGYKAKHRRMVSTSPDQLQIVINRIKKTGKGKEFNVVLGISGGRDSSYLAYLAMIYNLRVLLVHLDNGYNTPEAEKNMQNIVKHTGFEFLRIRADPDEFRDLQLAYLKASVVDIEAITDHALAATICKVAAEKGIKYVLSGLNVVTEGIMPTAWHWDKLDVKNLKNIHKQFGKRKLKAFPMMGELKKRIYYEGIKGIKTVHLLNLVDYNINEVEKILQKELEWEDYGDKHGESIFTRFFQNWILPKKFKIDKRRAHYSTLICSGQLTREEALERLKAPLYNKELLETDFKFVLKMLRLTPSEFEEFMKLPIQPHEEYRTSSALHKFKRVAKKILRR